MIPDESLSLVEMFAPYLYPDDLFVTKLVDYELGGTALNDASDGLEVQKWTLRLEVDELTGMGDVYISADTVAETLLFSGDGITEISLTFDQNMNPAVGFMQSGEARLRWYDATIPGFTIITLPAGTTAPKLCLDDKRNLQTSASDIIMCYERAGSLYFRAQRDRFLVEYLLTTGVDGQVLKIGMNEKYRLQIAVGEFE